MVINFPYGKEKLALDFGENKVNVLRSKIEEYIPLDTPENLVKTALKNPVGSPPLSVLAKDKKNIVIIASDHTRPVPSKVIFPALLSEIRSVSPEAKITILIATGCHRGTTVEELTNKFGEDIVKNENIVIHDCDDKDKYLSLGKLPSGGEFIVNKIAYEADLLISEGFIEPHFFAGFSGGRKSVLPGVCARSTVMYNHNATFIDSKFARTGILENNPIHRDMIYAAKKANLKFIINVVINAEKKAVYAVSGDVEQAHLKGCEFLNKLCMVQTIPADIALSTNGGYPLDQNLYQSIKGMTAAETAVKENGVIIMFSKCSDGHGGEVLFETFKKEKDIDKMMQTFLATPPEKTLVDQWQSQILARILKKATVIFVSNAPDDMVKEFQLIPCHSGTEALKMAKEILLKRGITNPTITAIPDGVSVIVRAKE